MSIYKSIFLYGNMILYILSFFVIFGITTIAPIYLKYIRSFLQIYIGILLIILYNPLTFKKKDFTEFDRKLIFSSGIFLLLSSALISIIEQNIYLIERIIPNSGIIKELIYNLREKLI